MTLAAAILFVGISSFTLLDVMVLGQSVPRSDSSASTSAGQAQTSPQATPETTKPSSSQTSNAEAQASKPKANTAKKNRGRKKVTPDPNCDSAPANTSSTGSSQNQGSPQSGGGQGSSNTQAPSNCPPPKIVVRQGGIKEQSIQLAGGSSGGDTTQKRQSTNQMLAITEENLKKVVTVSLSTEQQNSVSQIRQFVNQSKSALSAADFERAHTLAWKAKVLSDDLVSPKK